MICITELNNKVNELYEKYKDDEVILNKLNHHIMNEVSTILINAKKLQKNREDRKNLLQEAHDIFVNKFINRNIYFYCNTSEIFFTYNNDYYSIIKEDNIIYNILSTLNYKDCEHELEYFQEQLLPWKFKIKTSIIKQIREIPIFTSIPESLTIQNIIWLFESLFNSKNEIKYFLTIIGDTILKKTININIISSSAKTFIRNLENLGGQYFGHIPLQNSFRYKYHDHNYQQCRILIVKDKSCSEICEIIQTNIINIFVVSAYYSNRYNSADEYLSTCDDGDLQERILFLKNNNQDEIVQKFINNKLQDSNDSTISMKNMLFLWKCYLEEINIPNVIFSTTLKTLLKNKINYDEEKDVFYNYTSLGLPLVSSFLKFWEETIKEDDNEYYLEIDEICVLFKQWGKKSQIIKENKFINLLKHFYPNIIIDNKYIYGITSTIWNKRKELINFLKYKSTISESDILPISIYQLYREYSKYAKKAKNIIISKTYFDLFINNYLKKYINEGMVCLKEINFS
jgi:hypothetical protein